MNVTEATQAREIPRPSITRAADVAGAELKAMLDLLPRLADDQWLLPTSCAGWTVRDVVCHVVGAYEEASRPWLMLRRIRQARRDSPELGALDGHNQRQVADRRELTGAQLTGLLARFGPGGLRALRRMPAPMRRVRLSRVFPEAPPYGWPRCVSRSDWSPQWMALSSAHCSSR